jgi:hypothetical protein
LVGNEMYFFPELKKDHPSLILQHQTHLWIETEVNKFVDVFDAVKSEMDGLFSKVMALRIGLIDHLMKQC